MKAFNECGDSPQVQKSEIHRHKYFLFLAFLGNKNSYVLIQ